ncbi:MAG: cation acetate symporter [Bacteroidales bacterium]|nr:cation acetate symporter [Bacteroidales bacterium]
MIYDVSFLAILLFVVFVAIVLGLSFYYGRKTKSASGYYAAGGTIHWGVNGIAFAGDYLSAASFLGICGMIAFSGYDGYLYSIGFLAGWVVALFIVAEPLKRLGKYTFTDALDAKFNSRSIKLTASISTLIVSLFYLIPQMVGSGDLVVPLLGLPHWMGVVLVGAIVIIIVATAGMTSTTYVQFIKGGLLIIASIILTASVLINGFNKKPYDNYHEFVTATAIKSGNEWKVVDNEKLSIIRIIEVKDKQYAKVKYEGYDRYFQLIRQNDSLYQLVEMISIAQTPTGTLYNGAPKEERKFYQVGHFHKIIDNGKEIESTGSLNPINFFSKIEQSEIVRFSKVNFLDGENKITAFYQDITPGTAILKPGLFYKLEGATIWQKLNFISLMLALFFGTSALPHVLIRYYTVPSQKDARRSTIVAVATIGFFYMLTLYMGLGAMINGVIDVESSNMAAPLLAKYFGIGLFAFITAIAFATILGTVAGLITASSGAIAHDFIDNYLGKNLSEKAKVRAGRLAAFAVGLISIILGILFKGMNVSFLVGLAFSIAASANLPAILMILFWKKTTSNGIAASIITGIIMSVGIILLSPSMYERYGLNPADAPIPIDNPGIFSIPASFIVLIIVSLLTQKNKAKEVS